MTAVADLPPPSALDLAHGLHADVPENVYHRPVFGLASKHALDLFGRAPAVYKAWIDGGLELADKPAFLFGRILHTQVLEPHRFGERFAIEPDFGDCRKKENKANRDTWRQANAAKEWISLEDARRALAMGAALERHPLARMLLSASAAEVTLRWARRGIECKGRVDGHAAQFDAALDLKSTEDASTEAFARDVARYDYHRQEAFYRTGFAALGKPLEHFVFIVVEKAPPHLVGVYVLDDEARALGVRENDELLERFSSCIATDTWPGLPEKVTSIRLPAWRTRKDRT